MDHIGKHVLKKSSHYHFLLGFLRMFLEIQLNSNSSQGPWHGHFYYIAFQTIPPQPLSFKQSPSHTQHVWGKSFRSCFGWILSHLYRFRRYLEDIMYSYHVGMQHIYIMNNSSSFIKLTSTSNFLKYIWEGIPTHPINQPFLENSPIPPKKKIKIQTSVWKKSGVLIFPTNTALMEGNIPQDYHSKFGLPK